MFGAISRCSCNCFLGLSDSTFVLGVFLNSITNHTKNFVHAIVFLGLSGSTFVLGVL